MARRDDDRFGMDHDMEGAPLRTGYGGFGPEGGYGGFGRGPEQRRAEDVIGGANASPDRLIDEAQHLGRPRAGRAFVGGGLPPTPGDVRGTYAEGGLDERTAGGTMREREAYPGAPYSGPGTGSWGREARGSFAGRGPRSRRADERIEADVCESLTWHPAIDASGVEVQVEGGEVTLRGTVQDRRAKRLAEDVAEEVRGVSDVHNRLTFERRP